MAAKKIKKTFKNLFYKVIAEIDCRYQKNGLNQIPEKSSKVRIMINYYKPSFIFNNSVCTPIHCGRAIMKKNSDYRWLCKHMIGDNTGENISDLNKVFNELTGIYWTWKNYEKIGDPEYIGFMSYRVLYSIKDYPSPNTGRNFLDKHGYTEKRILNLFKANNATFLSGPFFELHCPVFYWCNTDAFWEIEDKFSQILKENSPIEFEEWKAFIKQFNQGPFKYMFITTKDEFFKYCNWLFPKLLAVKDNVKNITNGDYARTIAFLAEVVTSFYFYNLGKTCNHVDLSTFQVFLS